MGEMSVMLAAAIVCHAAGLCRKYVSNSQRVILAQITFAPAVGHAALAEPAPGCVEANQELLAVDGTAWAAHHAFVGHRGPQWRVAVPAALPEPVPAAPGRLQSGWGPAAANQACCSSAQR